MEDPATPCNIYLLYCEYSSRLCIIIYTLIILHKAEWGGLYFVQQYNLYLWYILLFMKIGIIDHIPGWLIIFNISNQFIFPILGTHLQVGKTNSKTLFIIFCTVASLLAPLGGI